MLWAKCVRERESERETERAPVNEWTTLNPTKNEYMHGLGAQWHIYLPNQKTVKTKLEIYSCNYALKWATIFQ